MKTSKSNPPSSGQYVETITSETTTIRHLPWTYFHLSLISSEITSQATDAEVDILTARTYLTSALQQFLGITGTAIPVDFLKVEGRNIWIRVPRDDSAVVVSALSGWIGREGVAWRIKGKSEWLGSLIAGDGSHLFEA
ncbi:MAG: hypothetical protein L6R38_003348 [Xanthoria sp. 2 TBL-2021]|nr:MAG: hypothetical protein L6R38_003348 [Xanthoria sp. 2 TBL-2021]